MFTWACGVCGWWNVENGNVSGKAKRDCYSCNVLRGVKQ